MGVTYTSRNFAREIREKEAKRKERLLDAPRFVMLQLEQVAHTQ